MVAGDAWPMNSPVIDRLGRPVFQGRLGAGPVWRVPSTGRPMPMRPGKTARCVQLGTFVRLDRFCSMR